MRFARGDVRDHVVSDKTAADLRISAEKGSIGRDGQEEAFARISVQFDFRLFQQHRHKADPRWTLLDFVDLALVERVEGGP